MNHKYDIKRPSIPMDIQRTVKVQAQHKCTMCSEDYGLEIHHIDENRENNNIKNLILLCSKHHKMAHDNKIDRKSLRRYKIEPIKTIQNQPQFTTHDKKVFDKLKQILSWEYIGHIPQDSYSSDFNDETFLPFNNFLIQCRNPEFRFINSDLEKVRLEIEKKSKILFNMIGKYKYGNGGMYHIGPTELSVESDKDMKHWSKITSEFDYNLLDICHLYEKLFTIQRSLKNEA